MSIEAMKQALAALETCRIRSVSEWEVSDVTPKNVTAAISALRAAIQQAESEPVYWEWRHQGSHPDAFDFGQWSEWKRVEPRSALHTVEDALNEFRGYIARGHKYELRALYTHPAPGVPVGEVHSFGDTGLCDEVQLYNPLPWFTKLYTHPAPGVPDGVVRDAERYRWLRVACFGGYMLGWNFNLNCDEPEAEWDAAIDAAMLTAAQAQKGGE